ncbi:hypothetical protein GGR07_001944 [Bacteroides pyogenes]|nr:hypothetical protein [Bacteroides pyogenes]SUV34359.1 Uncharacterised protein [Bacteroides pyogenes]
MLPDYDKGLSGETTAPYLLPANHKRSLTCN